MRSTLQETQEALFVSNRVYPRKRQVAIQSNIYLGTYDARSH